MGIARREKAAKPGAANLFAVCIDAALRRAGFSGDRDPRGIGARRCGVHRTPQQPPQRFDRFFPAVVALSLNSGAYLSEIIRSGIQSIDIGQTEAARSLGLSSVKTMRFVILPQAIKNILPAIANEFVTIIKESAICYTIGVQDIMSAVNAVKGATYRMAEALIIATALYFCLTYPTSKIIAHFERKMSAGDKR